MRRSLSVESLKISHIPSLGYSVMGSRYLKITEMVLSMARNWMTLWSIWRSNYWKHSFQLWQDFSQHCFNQKRDKNDVQIVHSRRDHWIVASRASSGLVKVYDSVYDTVDKLQIKSKIYLKEHVCHWRFYSSVLWHWPCDHYVWRRSYASLPCELLRKRNSLFVSNHGPLRW